MTNGIFTAGTSTVTLRGTGDQLITTNYQTFNDLIILNTGALGSNDVIVSGVLDVDGTVSVQDGSLDFATNNDHGYMAGNVEVLSAGLWRKGTGMLTFDGDVTYSDMTDSIDLGNLIIGASPETTTLTTNLIASMLTINAGDTLETVGYDVDIAGTIDINGTLDATTGAGGGSNIYVGKDWLMDTAGTFVASTSTVVFDGAGAGNTITSSGRTFNDLRIDNADGIWDLVDALELSGSLSVSSGSLGTSSYDIDIDGDVFLTGTITAGASSITVGGDWNSANGSYKYGTSTVSMIGTGSISNTTSSYFYDLKLAFPSKTSTLDSNIYQYGVLFVNGGIMSSRTAYINYSLGDTPVLIASGSTINSSLFIHGGVGKRWGWNNSYSILYLWRCVDV